jgi:hypothetical protein
MDEEIFYNQLFNLLDDNGIHYEDEQANRVRAIHLILELKRKKAEKFKKQIISEEEIIVKYIETGINGVKKMFKRNECYLYDSDFVYSILFFHYNQQWELIENLIEWKITEDYE